MKYKIFFIIQILFLTTPCLQAKPLVGSIINTALSRDELQKKVATIKVTKGGDEDSKQKQIQWYQSADENIANKKWNEFITTTYEELIKTTPKVLEKKYQSHIDKKYQLKKNPLEKDYELQLVNLKAELRSINDKLDNLENILTKNKLRPKEIREEKLHANNGIEQSKVILNSKNSQLESEYENEARKAYLNSLIEAYAAELKKLDSEVISNPIQIQLYKKHVEDLTVHKEQLEQVISDRNSALKQLRLLKDQKLAEDLLKVEQESSQKSPLIQTIISENVQLGKDFHSTEQLIYQYKHEISLIEAYKQEIAQYYKGTDKKIKLASLSPALGRVLREQRVNLAKNKLQYLQELDLSSNADLISLAQYEIELKQQKFRYINKSIEETITQLNSSLAKKLSKREQRKINQEIEQLLTTQKQLLHDLSDVYFKALRVFGDYDFLRKQILIDITDFETYLDERLFWVPSSLAINSNYPSRLYHSLQWLLSPEKWGKVTQSLLLSVQKNRLKSAMFTAFLVLIFYVNIQLQSHLSNIRKKVEKVYTDKLHYTFQVFLANIISAAVIPLCLAFIAYMLSNLSIQENFTRAVGAGLQQLAISFFILRFFLRMLEDKGIAQLHFSWSVASTQYISKQILWLQFIVFPSFFVIYLTANVDNTAHSDSLGRLSLIIFMLALSYCFIKALINKTSGLQAHIKAHKHYWWVKIRYLWGAATIAIPFIIIGFALAGYYLSALELQQKVIVSLRLIFIAVIVHSLVIRWLSLLNRKMALDNARKKNAAHDLPAQDAIILEEEILDISTINKQTIKIVNITILAVVAIGTWLVWQNIFPAFSFLDNIVLWQHTVMVDQQATLQAITLTDLCFSALYLFIIITAVINFPGLMEVLLFQHSNIESGSRYAINQLAKYLMITIGFIAIANKLGGSWSQVQWLVAALTVGLGFGLQEIFANMVSGIILLFERPIRVGDTVTVDNITGRVTRIQMRATTLLDWDKKELIVPNKTFITNQLINWSLTSPMTRLVIPLGISYDADVKLAHKVIKEAVISSPLILTTPEPTVIFTGFGDSSLDFSIRVYVSELDNRLPAKHDLHMRLLSALREAGIEIPFPQRDLHIRSVDEGELNLTQKKGIKA